MPVQMRRAFHEAGHAYAAYHYNIGIEQISLSAPAAGAICSRFQRMESYCRLLPGFPANLVRLEQFIIFLLAGSVAEMLAIERHYQRVPQSTTQRRFRERWFTNAWDNPEPRVDAAYFAIVAWMPAVNAYDIAKERRLWTRACELLEGGDRWTGVDHIARSIAGRRRTNQLENRALAAGMELAAAAATQFVLQSATHICSPRTVRPWSRTLWGRNGWRRYGKPS